MKNYAVIAVLVCIAFVTLAAVPSHGQVLFKGNVPFDFYVGGGVLPAGEYSINRSFWSGQALSLYSGVRGLEIMMPLTTESRRGIQTAKLIFHRYGSEHFLAEMWTGTDSSVRTFSVHPREQQLAKSGLTPQTAVAYGLSPSTVGN